MNCTNYFEKKVNIQEAICLMETKINEIVDAYNRVDADHKVIAEKVKELEGLVDYLIGEGLASEVKRQLEVWLADGTIANLINKTIFVDIQNRLAVVEKVETEEVHLIKYLKFDGSDETTELQKLIDSFVINSDKTLVLTFPSNKEIELHNISLKGNVRIKGNYCLIKSANNSFDYVFTNGINKGLHLIVDDLRLKDIGLANMSMDKSVSSLKLWCKNITGFSTGQKGTFVNAKSNDFMNLENIYLYNYETGINIASLFPADRMNTQISFKNIIILFTKYGFYMTGVSKVALDNIDIARCSTGFIFGQYCSSMVMSNIHIETYGNYGAETSRDGYGMYFSNNNQVKDVIVNGGDITLPLDDSRGGIYINPVNSVSNYDTLISVVFNRVYVEPKIGKVALTLNGNIEWNGAFNYKKDQVNLYGSNNRILNVKVKPIHSNGSRNIMDKSIIASSADFNTISTGVTVTNENGMAVVTNNNTTSDKEAVILFKPYTTGWHTIMFTGKFGGTDTIMIQENESPNTQLLITKCVPGNNYDVNTILVYIPDASKNIRLRFTIKPKSSLLLRDIGVYKGFKSEF